MAASDFKNLKLYYFTIVKGSYTMGRGEYVRLLLEDAGLDFEYVRYSAAEWQEEKAKLNAQGIRNASMPYITIDGKFFGNTVPVMRYVSKKLNKYQGDNDEEAQLLDAYADKIMDWAGKWGPAVFSNDEATVKKYKEEVVTKQHQYWNDIIGDSKGPYVLGEKVSYVDFVLFHLLEDDSDAKVDAETYPYLAAFVQAVQTRPNIAKYLTTERK